MTAVPAAAAPAAAVPAHDEPSRRAPRGRRWSQPMYWSHPRAATPTQVPNQFVFGTELLVAPITAPDDPDTAARLACAPGCPRAPGSTCSPAWSTTAAGEVVLHRDLAQHPRARRGRRHRPARPASGPRQRTGQPGALEVLVVVGADGSFELIEDDGTGPDDPDNCCPDADLVRAGDRHGDGRPGIGRSCACRPAQPAAALRRTFLGRGTAATRSLSRRSPAGRGTISREPGGSPCRSTTSPDQHAAGDASGPNPHSRRTTSPAGCSRCSTGRTSSTRPRRSSTPSRRRTGRCRYGCPTCRRWTWTAALEIGGRRDPAGRTTVPHDPSDVRRVNVPVRPDQRAGRRRAGGAPGRAGSSLPSVSTVKTAPLLRRPVRAHCSPATGVESRRPAGARQPARRDDRRGPARRTGSPGR